MKKHMNSQQGSPFDFGFKADKYCDKPIKFTEKDDNYDLVFASDFLSADQDSPVYADLLCDLKEADKSKEIHVWVNSCGGEVSTLTLLRQQLEGFDYVVTIGTGEIDSAGFMLWLCGDERYLSPFTFCMYHSLSSGQYGKAEEMKEYGNFLRNYQGAFESLADGVLTKEELDRGRYTEVWLLGSQLIERGVALPFSDYARRTRLVEIEAYEAGGEVFLKREDGLYARAEACDETHTKREVMRSLITKRKANETLAMEAVDALGDEFIDFMENWLMMKKGSIVKGRGFSCQSFVDDWEAFSGSQKTWEELKDMIVTWEKMLCTGVEFECGESECGESRFMFRIETQPPVGGIENENEPGKDGGCDERRGPKDGRKGNAKKERKKDGRG